VSSYLWNFGDGTTSTSRNPSHTYTNPGTYIITLTVSNAQGSESEQDSIRITTGTEHIYLCDGYAKDALFIPHANQLLSSMGAVQQGDDWVYQNPALNMTFYVHPVRTPEAMTAALGQQGSHIIFNGHSNFGLGASFADGTEVGEQVIEDIRYIDDPRFTNFSSDMVSVKVDGVQYGQAYPNWEPFFQDGTSGIMPYDFDEGTPPYNYYMTYKLQGDPTAYIVELANGDYLERFPDSNVAPWYDETGRAPNPLSLLERQYFITNPDPDFNYCEFTGTWPIQKEADDVKQYQGYNYQYHEPGTGANTARWNMYVKYPGTYEVRARWQADPSNATNAVYTVEHAGGSTNVQVNQTVASGSSGLLLGTYTFSAGSYWVTLSDNANGRVVADSIRLNPTFNPTKILQSEFRASASSGIAPLVIDFTDMSLLYAVPSATITERLWDFGDGTTSTEQNPRHTYAAPGIYTVSLRITDSTGAVDTETKQGFIAVGQTAPLRAQFNANRRRGSGRTIATFTDQSSGNITGWSWNFGDGTTSTEQNPVHTYNEPGVYTVQLTVTGPGGSHTETETNYVYNFVAGLLNDNVFRYKNHFGTSSYGKTILNTARSRIPQDEIRHVRMFYGSCNSCNYYVGTFHQGIMYCTTSDSDLYTALDYLEYYLLGMTDEQIIERLDRAQNIHEIFNFNLKPRSLR
jgi:PKD repeat protein